MNLLVRADSSSQIGLGHIMRDLVFVKRYPNAQITFACRDLAGNIIEKIPYPVHILSSDDSEELIEYIVSHTIDTVVFDHYGIDAAYEKQIKERTGAIIISMDDTYQPHHCDILYNPNIYASKQRYHTLVPKQCDLQCGQPLIREEFALAKRNPKPKTDFFFLSMGGSDPQNLSLEILDLLPAQTPVHLVTTSSNPHLKTLRTYADEHPNIRLHVNASNIAELMHESSFAIITPSTVAHEVMFMELPFIAIQSADNQHEFVAYMRQKGFDVLERFDKNAFKTLLERAMISMIPFSKLSISETQMILSWRNHPDIRKWMVHQDEIPMEDHLSFIRSLPNRPDKRYFLVRKADKYLGVVDLTDITETSAELGLYANPQMRGKGKILMDALLNYAKSLGLKKIIANVFAHNERAKDLYAKFDFTETGRAVHDGTEMITLERTL